MEVKWSEKCDAPGRSIIKHSMGAQTWAWEALAITGSVKLISTRGETFVCGSAVIHPQQTTVRASVATFTQTSSVFVSTHLLLPLHQPISCRAGGSKCISTDGANWCELNQHSSFSSTSGKRILYGYSWICLYSALLFSKVCWIDPLRTKQWWAENS